MVSSKHINTLPDVGKKTRMLYTIERYCMCRCLECTCAIMKILHFLHSI